MGMSLPDRLKSRTIELHRRAERSGVMGELLAGRARPAGYAALLSSLLVLYEALERALDGHGEALRRLGAALPVPSRVRALRDDLDCLARAGWPARAAPAAATVAYVRRLSAIDAAGAHRLIAHAYVRTLGDLHGGQILMRLVREAFASLESGEGTRFYEFGDAERLQALREEFRSRLAAIRLPTALADEVVAEACWRFEQHGTMFEQIDGPPSEARRSFNG
jgi:heme oxygenase